MMLRQKEIKQWKRSEVLKDYRFYIICLTMLAMPSIATGTFVYQSFIVSSKKLGTLCNSPILYGIFSSISYYFIFIWVFD